MVEQSDETEIQQAALSELREQCNRISSDTNSTQNKGLLLLAFWVSLIAVVATINPQLATKIIHAQPIIQIMAVIF